MSAQDLSTRASTYRLLAQLYRREISPDMAASLVEAGVLDLLVDEGYDLEPDAMAEPQALTKLRREYTAIFLGPGEHVAPYGSVHHPDEAGKAQLWGQTTQWVHRFAGDHGVKFEGPTYDGIPDHVGHELELFALLLDGQAQALDEDDAERAERLVNSQALLHRTQLARWVPIFCERVRAKAKRPFYAELARVTSDLIELEAPRFEGLE